MIKDNAGKQLCTKAGESYIRHLCISDPTRSCATWGKILNFSEFNYTNLYNDDDNDNNYLLELFWQKSIYDICKRAQHLENIKCAINFSCFR